MNLYLNDPRRAALWEKHQARLQEALQAWHQRTYWYAYPEDPKAYGENAPSQGEAAFKAQLGRPFDRLRQPAERWLTSDEVSPYTREPLGIAYPQVSTAEALFRAQEALSQWRWVPYTERLGVLMESVERFSQHFFEVGHATMHTTGQAWMMAFQASGPHAADRAVEALAVAYQELSHIPPQARWVRDFGKVQAVVEKYFIPQPEGLSLHIGVSTFPVWNVLPGLYASLAVGSPVLMKPHPRAIYPIAIVVSLLQAVFEEYGLSPFIVQLLPDTSAEPITKQLAEHPLIRIIDYTGSTEFGEYIERLPGKITFLEKAGVNGVLIESVEDIEIVAKNLAFSASLYSGQMCTAPQNVYIPQEGVKTPQGNLSYEEVVAALTKAVEDLVSHPKAAPAILGALQHDTVAERIASLASSAPTVRRSPHPYTHPQYATARTLTPILAESPIPDEAFTKVEHFGPRLLFIAVESARRGLEILYQLAREKGMLSCAIYTTDPEFKLQATRLLSEAAVPLSFNFRGQVFINQSVAFSDFHGTGGNPAGNASFTDVSFIVKRFRWIGIRDCQQG
ncbi:MAG: phenylacetic acid degradation protein PaaN [Bacteroidia bacterium]|nr:phenylacetic acid degradation protein PaaN [Bacteroidia bacterium]MCX7652228.1 phenylacetic acid degradation protein PaaN [Bacteroidia bacterium]MDW8416490.1 phenylacetic acid degradation protein PaaN [Bacteroidia bacterium]